MISRIIAICNDILTRIFRYNLLNELFFGVWYVYRLLILPDLFFGIRNFEVMAIILALLFVFRFPSHYLE